MRRFDTTEPCHPDERDRLPARRLPEAWWRPTRWIPVALLLLLSGCLSAPPLGGSFDARGDDAGADLDASAELEAGPDILDTTSPDLDATPPKPDEVSEPTPEESEAAEPLSDAEVEAEPLPEVEEAETAPETEDVEPELPPDCELVPDCSELVPSGPCHEYAVDPWICECAEVLRGVKAPCDDGLACTLGDMCLEGGQCAGVPGDDLCDDGEPCTDDTCDVQAGCVNTPDDTNDCDDGNDCTVGDACVSGVCEPGGYGAFCGACDPDADTCEDDWGDGDACNGIVRCLEGQCRHDPVTVILCPAIQDEDCQAYACVPTTGACALGPLPDGATCSDGDPCTLEDACAEGACVGSPDEESTECGCEEDEDCAPLEDGDLCNGTLACVEGACGVDPATVVSCDPAADTACTRNTCEPTTGACAPMTIFEDTCAPEDHPEHTLGPCQELTWSQPNCACLVTFKADGDPCSDGDACTDDDACDPAGACAGTPVDVATACDDGDPCTTDGCEPATGCTHAPVEPSDAPELCNGVDDDCDGLTDMHDALDLLEDDPQGCEKQQGVCAGAKKPAGFCQGGAWQDCDAGFYAQLNDYHAGPDDTCDGKDNDCDGATDEDYAPATISCGEGACQTSGATACVEGSVIEDCTPGTGAADDATCDGVDDDCDGLTDEDVIMDCDDGDPCTQDGCDGGACTHDAAAMNGTSCDDGDPCTLGTLCDGGLCAGGTTDPCDDENPCTADACVAGSGCAHDDEPMDATPCEDDDPCTIDTTCTGGACGGGTTDPCDDGDPCTTDGCDPLTVGCTHDPGGAGALEVCNGVDDDCDGLTDAADADDLSANDVQACEKQQGVCAGMNKAPALCLGGAWQECGDEFYGLNQLDYEAGTETKDDGLDNDCDGEIDEGLCVISSDCAPGEDCVAGVCEPAAEADGDGDGDPDGTDCAPQDPLIHHAAEETCNDVDDDCDGETDEGDVPGAGEPCTLDFYQGVCRQGETGCEFGFMLCYQTVFSSAELCNGLDDDCDGQTDDVTPEGACDALTPGFVYIPPGSFWMGSPNGESCEDLPGYTGGGCPESGVAAVEPGRSDNENLHHVTLTTPFEIMTTEVTQAQWKEVATAQGWVGEPSYFADCGSGDDCPVELVNWFEAVAYANAMSGAAGLEACYVLTGCAGEIGAGCGGGEGQWYCWEGAYQCSGVSLASSYTKPQDCPGYRLPTEAEWEHVYRAGSQTAFYPSDGNDGHILSTSSGGACAVDANLDLIGVYCGGDVDQPAPVGTKAANAWNVRDIAGNAWEWCADARRNDLGAVAELDPYFAGSADSSRAMRGGSWFGLPEDARAATRSFDGFDVRSYLVGFRLVRSLL